MFFFGLLCLELRQRGFAQQFFVAQFVGLLVSDIGFLGIFFFILAHGLPFHDRVGDLADHQLDGADGVIVGGDRVVDFGGVTVGVDHGHDRNLEQVGLMNGGIFPACIHDEEDLRVPVHFANAAEEHFKPLDLAMFAQGFFFGQDVEVAAIAQALQAIQLVDALLNRGPVGQRAAQPAPGYPGHVAAFRL